MVYQKGKGQRGPTVFGKIMVFYLFHLRVVIYIHKFTKITRKFDFGKLFLSQFKYKINMIIDGYKFVRGRFRRHTFLRASQGYSTAFFLKTAVSRLLSPNAGIVIGIRRTRPCKKSLTMSILISIFLSSFINNPSFLSFISM